MIKVSSTNQESTQGSTVVRVMNLWSTGRTPFDSQPLHCQAATLGKLFTLVPSDSEVMTVLCYRDLM